MTRPVNNDRSLAQRHLRRLGRLIADLNIFLAPVAICLLILETTLLLTVIISNEILHRYGVGMASAVYATPALGAGVRGSQ